MNQKWIYHGVEYLNREAMVIAIIEALKESLTKELAEDYGFEDELDD